RSMLMWFLHKGTLLDEEGIPPTPVPTRDVQDGHSFAVMLAGHRTDVEGAVTSAPLQMDNILLNIVRQLRVLLRDVFGVHYLEVPTVDQHDAEEGIILQCWTLEDNEEREVRHGVYVQVILLPLIGAASDTDFALEVADLLYALKMIWPRERDSLMLQGAIAPGTSLEVRVPQLQVPRPGVLIVFDARDRIAVALLSHGSQKHGSPPGLPVIIYLFHGELVAHDHRPRVCPRVINLEYESLLEVCFHFDCMFAGMAVQGLWKADFIFCQQLLRRRELVAYNFGFAPRGGLDPLFLCQLERIEQKRKILQGPRLRLQHMDLTIVEKDHGRVKLVLSKSCRIGARRSDATSPNIIDIQLGLEEPRISWNVDVRTHAAHIRAWAKQRAPPKPRAPKRKSYLQDETLRLIRCKRFRWNRLRSLKRMVRQSCLRELFAAWHFGKRTIFASLLLCSYSRFVEAKKLSMASCDSMLLRRQQTFCFHCGEFLKLKGLTLINYLLMLLYMAKRLRCCKVKCITTHSFLNCQAPIVACVDDIALQFYSVVVMVLHSCEGNASLKAFALWGRGELYDVLERMEDIDCKLSNDVLVCSLIDRLKALHRAVPPEAPSPEIPVVHTDTRSKHAAEPLHSACDQADGRFHHERLLHLLQDSAGQQSRQR
ncbi:unnamed protein product, partial [Cladocopium goreaui]